MSNNEAATVTAEECKNQVFKQVYPKMYILVNSDLNMRTGKIAGQVGHAVEKICEEYYCGKLSRFDGTVWNDWQKNGSTKIILKATQKQILDIQYSYRDVWVVKDLGRTEIPANSITVLAFFPMYSSEAPSTIQTLKLLSDKVS